MIGMTLCSGIGAPEMAAPWVDWRLASEIEAFPRAVLQARFGYKLPENHNQGDPLLWGDMTEVTPDLLRSRGVPLPDILVAGTPCQAFSIAGLRKGTDDQRGNLTLKFVETCHATVDARPDGKLAVLWENVPGVLSDKGNAFGCFLGGLVGALDPLIPCERPARGKSNAGWTWVKAGRIAIEDEDGKPTGEFEVVKAHHRCKWPSEGMVQGPRSRAAWSVLDAQFFGVAQRRKRVFVVVDFGNCVDPAAVLLEPDSMRGDPPTRGEAEQSSAEGAGASTQECGDSPIVIDRAAFNQGENAQFSPEISEKPSMPALVARGPHAVAARMTAIGEYTIDGTASTLKERDYKDATDIVAHSLRGEGYDASEDGSGRGTPIVPVAGAICRDSFSGGPSGRPEGAAAGHFVPIAFPAEMSGTQVAAPGPLSPALSVTHTTAIAQSWAVRRLTPTECARLQGFPDDHTAITYRGKPAADGPQYKAYGNSMAVPNIKWVMDRMKLSMEQIKRKPQS
ncbi:DNA cytosine methyltransferase [Planktotalea sp.]|uniref:DNA cytosine methyltransferase n=1 Tax=Planktotalea sp. TaxID=2029877 RepID=UPI003D6AFAB6